MQLFHPESTFWEEFVTKTLSSLRLTLNRLIIDKLKLNMSFT